MSAGRFNEDSRVKIPALLHLSRLGYDYLSLKQARWDPRSNIFPEIFEAALLRINPALRRDDIPPHEPPGPDADTCRLIHRLLASEYLNESQGRLPFQ